MSTQTKVRRDALPIPGIKPVGVTTQKRDSLGKTRTIQTVDTRIGKLDLELGVPTSETAAKLYDEMDFERAVQCYLWGLPTVAMEECKQGIQRDTGIGNGDMAIFKGYRDVSVFITPQLVTPYIVALIDLAETGPVVIDYPAGMTAGALLDWWDRPVTDLGIPGPDGGQGAKFLFVGPGQQAPQVDGYRVFRSRTFKTLLFYRVIETDPAKANALQTAVRIYPFSRRDNPPSMRVLTPRAEAEHRVQSHPRGLLYWERLAQALSPEPVEDRDRFFAAMLKPLGIEKGKPFNPDERQKKILTDAALVGEAMAKASAFEKRMEGYRYKPDASWDYVIPPWYAVDQDVENSTQFEERTALFYEGIGMSAGSITDTPGIGQSYLAVYRDAEGHALDGGKTYGLNIPPNVPAKLFWSVTLYDVETRCPIQNKEQIADRSSRGDLEKNADGSVDLYFGPTTPKGMEKNWIPTVPGKAWFTYIRLYGPLKPFFDKTWRPGEIEEVK
jgi:hypothetical protein